MRAPFDWAARQFAAMGRADARDLAIQIIARYEGTALLANTFRDPDLMARESARVTQWIDALDLPLQLKLARIGRVPGAGCRVPVPVPPGGGYAPASSSSAARVVKSSTRRGNSVASWCRSCGDQRARAICMPR